jgi:riboflavin synthase
MDWFAVDLSAETVSRTAQGLWTADQRLNLERALKVGDELGGHIVTGHVDGIGEVLSITAEGDSHRVIIRVPADLAPHIATKGSITVEGVSLTVNEVKDEPNGTSFGLNLIPHTWDVTTLGQFQVGQPVNLEIDVLARYLGRMRDYAARM